MSCEKSFDADADQPTIYIGSANLSANSNDENLREITGDPAHIVMARIYLTRFKEDYAAMNETYRSYFPPDRLPARTCVGVTGLAYDALIEIDLVCRRR
jgi:enamine deaminase RidA (YjgF/YER057c/UK114 family)